MRNKNGHVIYGELAYLDCLAPDASHIYCLIGSRAPLVVVEAMLLVGKTADEVCADPVLGLQGRQILVERAEILADCRQQGAA